MTSHHLRERLLADINKDIPQGLDWTAGALAYVQAEIRKHGEQKFTDYLMLKPTSQVPQKDYEAFITENVGYLGNFVNCLELLALPGNSRILDVACGSGWVGHFFARMDYNVYGFDIAPDMVDITKQRFRNDKLLAALAHSLDERFFPLDIENAPLPARLHGTFDAIILESCAHHFHDPLTAFKNLADGLRDDGIMVVIEGERRDGPLKDEYLSVMKEFATLERPYSKPQLEAILSYAGLEARQFLGRVPRGWFSPDDPAVDELPEYVRSFERHLNYVVAAKNETALQRVFPHRKPEQRAAVAAKARARSEHLDRLTAENAELRDGQMRLDRENADLKLQNQALSQQQQDMQQQQRDLNAALSALHNSTSWRVTFPLRWLMGLLRR